MYVFALAAYFVHCEMWLMNSIDQLKDLWELYQEGV